MITHLREELTAAHRECTRLLDHLRSGIQALEAAPVPSSDTEGDLRDYTRTLRVFARIYRAQFYTPRAVSLARTDAQQVDQNGGFDA